MAENYLYKTGVPGLDEIMMGGFITGHSVMIEGYTGTGKTIFGESIILAGINVFGRNGVIVSFEQLPESLYYDALSLGWDLRALERQNKLRVIFISPATLIEEITAQISRISELMVEIDAQQLFLDGINMLETVERDPFLKRQLMDRVIAAFHREGMNVFFSREKPEATPLGAAAESYIADTVIQLTHVQMHGRRIRYMEVIKSRGQDSLSGLHTFKIGRGGITVFPRQKMPALQPQPVAFGEEKLTLGLPELDNMLNGGVFKRSSTLVAGSSGTGKSTLCLQFIISGARKGEPGLFISLEEPAQQIVDHARNFAPDIDRLVESKLLIVESLSPLETDINEQIVQIRKAVTEGKIERLVFDSLSDYEQFLPEVEYKDYVFALTSFIKNSGVTALFTTEIRELTAVEKLTPYGTSYLLDNIIMLRFVELANSLRRAIVILKTRGSDHATDIREYVISEQGLGVLPIDPSLTVPILAMHEYAHILAGFPTPRDEAGETKLPAKVKKRKHDKRGRRAEGKGPVG